MPQANLKRELATKYYNEGFSYTEISKKTGVPLNTIRTWAARHWKKNATPKATGVGKGPPGNQHALIHGFNSKIIPDEIQKIVDEIKNWNEEEMLWQSILLQFAQILRSQSLIYVKDQSDKIQEITSETNGDSIQSRSYEIQQAWERQASLLTAQSKALSSLSNAIGNYVRICSKGIVSETHKQNLELIKAKVAALKATSEDDKDQIAKLDELLKGVKQIAEDKVSTDGSDAKAS